MANPFQMAAAAASAAVDQVYGEAWTYQPMAKSDPNGRAAPDPDRAVMPVTGTWFGPYARAFSGSARTQGVKAEQPGHASDRPVLDLDPTQLPYRLRGGDRAVRLLTGLLYELAELRPDGTGRVSCDLNLLGTAP